MSLRKRQLKQPINKKNTESYTLNSKQTQIYKFKTINLEFEIKVLDLFRV